MMIVIGGVLAACFGYLQRIYSRSKVRRLQQLQSEIHTFQSENGYLEYQCVGTGEPVLVFHGILGSYEHGRNAMWQFDLSSYQLISISRAGYWLKTNAAPGSLNQQADIIADLLNHLNIHQTIVVAMSAGGPAGLMFAARHSHKVCRLILLEAITKPFDYQRLNLLSTSRLIMRTINSDPVAWIITRAIVKFLPIVGLFSNKTRTRIINIPNRRATYERVTLSFFPIEFMTVGHHYDVELLKALEILPLNEIDSPCLILHGKADQVVPLEHSQYAAEHIAHSKLLTVGDGADHDFHITHPEVVWGAIFEFLQNEKEKVDR